MAHKFVIMYRCLHFLYFSLNLGKFIFHLSSFDYAQDDHPTLKFSKVQFLIMILLLTSPIPIHAQDPDPASLKPPRLGPLDHVHDYMDRIGDYGERIVVWQYRRENESLSSGEMTASVTVMYDSEHFRATRSEVERNFSATGLRTHPVTGWPVALYSSTSDRVEYSTSKGHFSVNVVVSDPNSSAEAEQLADEAFAYILPKIPEIPEGNALDRQSGKGTTGDRDRSREKRGALDRDQTDRKALKDVTETQEEAERRLRGQEAQRAFEAESKLYEEKMREYAGALSEARAEGERASADLSETVSARIELIPPAVRLAVFREVDHTFGISVANRSSWDISKVKIDLYVQTESGEKKLGSAKVDQVKAGSIGSAPFRVAYQKLWDLAKMNLASTDVQMAAEYKVNWSWAYFGSDSKSETWPNALNPRMDGRLSPEEEKILAAAPPEILIQPVSDDGEPLNTFQLFPNTEYHMKFTIQYKPGTPRTCLATYEEPRWNPKPKEALYSSWGDEYDDSTPMDLSSSMDKFNKNSNRRFSGDLAGGSIHFFAKIRTPDARTGNPMEITLPIKYSYEANLKKEERYWNDAEEKEKFFIESPKRDEALSALVKMNVTGTTSRTFDRLAIVQPGGQISSFTGNVVFLQPTDRWWANDLKGWEKLNQKLIDLDVSGTVEQAGKEIAVSELVNLYSKRLAEGLGTVFTAKDIVNADSEEEIVRASAFGIAGSIHPVAGIMLPLLETAKVWYPRENVEKCLIEDASKADASDPFMRGTMYTSPEERLGTRIFFKVIHETMYAVELGKTNF